MGRQAGRVVAFVAQEGTPTDAGGRQATRRDASATADHCPTPLPCLCALPGELSGVGLAWQYRSEGSGGMTHRDRGVGEVSY